MITERIIKPFHSRFIFERRLGHLSSLLSQLVPGNVPLTGLDVGCGNGRLACKLKELRNNVTIKGVDVLIRPETNAIEITSFDGKTLPFADRSFDFVMLIDVLHHAQEQLILLKECVRVSRRFVVIKDHFCESAWDRDRLKFMDWVGNRAYGVSLPYNYLSRQDWQRLFEQAGVREEETRQKLELYPLFFNNLFGHQLHFISKLAKT